MTKMKAIVRKKMRLPLLTICVLLTTLLAKGQPNTILYKDFEDPNIGLGWDGMEACCSYSMTTSTAYKRTGRQSLRVELRKTDPEIYSNKRAELSDNSYPIPHETNRRWWGFSTYFPSNFSRDSVHEVLAQWHYRATNVDLSASPPLSLQVYKGDWIVELRYDSVDINVDRGANIKLVSFNLGPWVRDQWTDWIFQYNYSYNNDGSLKIWKNGQLVLDYQGKNYYRGSYDPFFKIGLYRWVWGSSWPSQLEQSVLTSRVYYLDNIRIGNQQSILQDFLLPNPLPSNISPVASVGNNQNITLPVNTATIKGSGSIDPDGTITRYQWSVETAPQLPVMADINAPDLKVTGLQQGQYRFRLTVTDNNGATSSAMMDVNVSGTAAANRPPVANAGATRIITLPVNAVQLSAAGSSDPDGGIVSYAWSQESGPFLSQIANANTAAPTVSGLQKGSYYFKLVVTDNGGAFSTSYVQVYVDGTAVLPNLAPVAAAGNNQIITLPTSSVSLDGRASFDSDGTIASYNWYQVSGPSAAVLTGQNTATANAASLVAGNYTFGLIVMDNSGAADTARVSVLVNPVPAGVNLPPVSNAGASQTFAYFYNTITLRGSDSYDPDGSILSYSWSQDAGPSVLISTPDSATTICRNVAVSGTYVFRLRVTDNNGMTSSSTVTITLTPAVDGVSGIPLANALPVAVPGNGATYQNLYNTITLNGSQSYDPDGNIVSYKWVQESGPAIFLSTPDSFYCLARDPQAATYVFRLIVTDNKGGVSSAPVSFTLLPLPGSNQPPVADAGTDQSFQILYNTITLRATASSDPDGQIVTYRWTQESGPAGALMSYPDSSVNIVRNISVGTYIFRLVVVDNGGASDTARVTVNILPLAAAARVAGGTETIAATISAPVANRSAAWRWGDAQVVTYPNPVKSQLVIEMNSVQTGPVVVRIYNMQGAEIWHDRFEKTGALLQRTLYLSGVPAGMYLLRVTQGNRSILSRQINKLE